jgi:endo-1,4-beta-xylanase
MKLKSILKTMAMSLCFMLSFKAMAQPDSAKGLKDYYANYFPIGVAVSPGMLSNPEQAKLILKQFNSLTPENVMKMGAIHPTEGRYEWQYADAIVNFATQYHLRVRGHNLCWHEQTPRWMFYDSAGKQVTKKLLLKRLKEHIYTVVKRYKGKIYAWDVVNEAIADDPKQFLRNSLWYQICGEDFIFKAFEYAHQADPKAILFYNDYNTERPEKRERVYRLLKKLVDAKVPVNGVGLQAHWSIYEPSQKELIESIRRFASLGLQVQITELDISVFPWEKNIREKIYDGRDSCTLDAQTRQTAQYKMVFETFRKYKGGITGVTFWNLSDRHSWLDNYPVKNRKTYPLLFDRDLKPKPAYREVVNF